jgi:hypothetical protein
MSVNRQGGTHSASPQRGGSGKKDSTQHGRSGKKDSTRRGGAGKHGFGGTSQSEVQLPHGVGLGWGLPERDCHSRYLEASCVVQDCTGNKGNEFVGGTERDTE